MKKYNCIIFDCDGVLVDTEPISIGVIVDMAKEHGYDMELQFAIDHFRGMQLDKCFEYVAEKSGRSLPENTITEFRKRSYADFKENLKPVDGVPELLHQLQLPFCVASSGPTEKIKLNLGITNLSRHFNDDSIFSCYEIDSWKPEPDIFLHAAKSMGFEPHECIVIEDSLPGVQAAKEGGFDVFGFATQKHKAEMEAAGATVFFEMQELHELLPI
jgi:HAD superfamily hydrolase (TIGR01509 family)